MPVTPIRGFRRLIVTAPAALALAVIAMLTFQHSHDLTWAATLLVAFRPDDHEADLAAIETALAQNDVRGAAARLRPLSESLAPLIVLSREPGSQTARAFLARYRKAYRETTFRYSVLMQPDDLAIVEATTSNPPVLGDTLPRFVSRFGEAVQTRPSTFGFQRCPGRSRDPRLQVRVVGGRVTYITRTRCFGRRLDPQAAASEAATLMPADATPPQLIYEYGSITERRQSESLARAFTPNTSEGCRVSERPGTFSFRLFPDRRGWRLAIETCRVVLWLTD